MRQLLLSLALALTSHFLWALSSLKDYDTFFQTFESDLLISPPFSFTSLQAKDLCKRQGLEEDDPLFEACAFDLRATGELLRHIHKCQKND